jgi:hypothetical protein
LSQNPQQKTRRTHSAAGPTVFAVGTVPVRYYGTVRYRR